MVFAGSRAGDFGASEVAEKTGVEPAEEPVGTWRKSAARLVIVGLGSHSAKMSEAR